LIGIDRQDQIRIQGEPGASVGDRSQPTDNALVDAGIFEPAGYLLRPRHSP
jgi:hypothetical protein